MNTKTLTAVALIAALVPAVTYAQSRPQSPQIDFATADADGSGGISQTEWTSYISAQIADRMAQRVGERADALIGAGDADADGALTRDELVTGMTALHEQRRAERAERRAEGGEERGGRHGGRHEGRRGGYGDDDDRGGRFGRMGHRGSRGMEPEARATAFFERIDDNGDGQIDAEELAEMQERMERRMERRMGRDNN